MLILTRRALIALRLSPTHRIPDDEMFAKPRDNGRRRTEKTRSGLKSARPGFLPECLRSDPDGELAAMYRQVKTASSSKRTMPVKPMTRHETQSKVGNKSRRPDSKAILAAAPVPEPRDGTIQNASTLERLGLGSEMCRETELVSEEIYSVGSEERLGSDFSEEEELELESSEGIGNFRSKKALKESDLNLMVAIGLARLEYCKTSRKTTPEVFATFAKSFHDILDHVAYVTSTSDVSTQTSPSPRLQRTQTHFIYAGPWESCTSRQHRAVQTEDRNLTFVKHRATTMLSKNSKTSWTFSGWKCFGVMFLAVTVVLGLIKILELLFGIS